MTRSATSPLLCSSVDVWSCNGFSGAVCFGPRQVFLCVMSACIILSRPQAVLLWLRMQHVPLLGSVMVLGEQWKVRFARITGSVELLARTHTPIHAQDMHKCIMQRWCLAHTSPGVMGGDLLPLSSFSSQCSCLNSMVSSYGYKQLRLRTNCTLASSVSC